MKQFWLERVEDESGISGTGIVAEGVIFKNGWCSMHWLTQFTSVAFYPSIQEVENIHGHNGKTKLVYSQPKLTDKGSETEGPKGKACHICHLFACEHLGSFLPR